MHLFKHLILVLVLIDILRRPAIAVPCAASPHMPDKSTLFPAQGARHLFVQAHEGRGRSLSGDVRVSRAAAARVEEELLRG